MNDIHPLKPAAELSLLNVLLELFLWTFLTILAVAFLVWAYFRFFVPKQEYIQQPSSIPKKDLRAEYLQKINQLMKKSDSENIREQFVSLSEILRGYLEEEHDFPALSLTSEEILHHQKIVQQEVMTTCSEFFDLCLAAEFAPQKALQKDFEEACSLAQKIITS